MSSSLLKKRKRNKGRLRSRTAKGTMASKLIKRSELTEERLVPVMLNFKIASLRVHIVEQFLWNLAAKENELIKFVEDYCLDMNYAKQAVPCMVKEIKSQLKNAEDIFKRSGPPIPSSWEVPLENEFLRIIKLNIRYGEKVLRDQFEWDIGDVSNSPESFARSLAADLSLPRAWEPLISCSIREQILKYREQIARREHKEVIRKPVSKRDAIRNELEDWTPVLTDFHDDDPSTFDTHNAMVPSTQSSIGPVTKQNLLYCPIGYEIPPLGPRRNKAKYINVQHALMEMGELASKPRQRPHKTAFLGDLASAVYSDEEEEETISNPQVENDPVLQIFPSIRLDLLPQTQDHGEEENQV